MAIDARSNPLIGGIPLLSRFAPRVGLVPLRQIFVRRCQSCVAWAAASREGTRLLVGRLLSAGMQPGAAGRPVTQAGAALALGVIQQAFKHATGIWVAGVIAAQVTPAAEVPTDRASFGDHLHK